MTTQPHVSVIVPVFNGARTLAACLDALQDVAPETPRFEVIVVDNGSTDDSVAVATNYPVRLLHCDIRGAAAARNTGVAAARGRILAFTDADCVPDSRWILEGVSALEDPRVAFVAGEITGTPAINQIQRWMNSRRILDPRGPLGHPFRPFAQTANAFFRTEDVRALGGFDAEIPAGEDCDLSWRVLEANPHCSAGFAPEARVQHDHRTSLRGLIRQAAKNASADAYLADRWSGRIERKRLTRSLWEVREVVRRAAVTPVALLRGADRGVNAALDTALALGRKYGMVRAAASTGRWYLW